MTVTKALGFVLVALYWGAALVYLWLGHDFASQGEWILALLAFTAGGMTAYLGGVELGRTLRD